MTTADDNGFDGLLNVTIKRISKNKVRFEVKRRQDGFVASPRYLKIVQLLG